MKNLDSDVATSARQARQKLHPKMPTYSSEPKVIDTLQWYNFVCSFLSNRFIHGLRTPNEAFFHWNPKLLGLGRQIGQINFVAFGVFSADLSAPILVLWVPCPCFPLINHYFYKKLSLYIPIPNIYLNIIGIWIWDAKNWGFSHRVSVVSG